MTRGISRLIYMDDSGEPKDGLAVLGWLDFAPDDWGHILGSWMPFRKSIWTDFGIPIEKELHATDYVHGRGNLIKSSRIKSLPERPDNLKTVGRIVAERALKTLSSTQGLSIGSCFRQTPHEPLQSTKALLYSEYLESLEDSLARQETHGLVFIDGNGTDSIYRTAHRQLPRDLRFVLEDPIHLNSKHSQFIQMADLVAWTANAAISTNPHNAFARDWYEMHLSVRDRHRKPKSLNS